jgi:hypothetical protein
MPDDKAPDPAASNFGVDSLNAADHKMLEAVTKHFGAPPFFWARYFNSAANLAKEGNYNPAKESAFLAENKIKLLPIARQTRQVAGDEKAGEVDGKANLEALKKAFGTLKDVYLFLDVEDDPGTQSPALSAAYFKGWHKVVKAGGLLPCLYVRQGSADTFKALAELKKKPEPEALWLARWIAKDGKPKPLPAKWGYPKLEEEGYKAASEAIPVWQYMNGPLFDCDMINPNAKDELAKHLITPPEK